MHSRQPGHHLFEMALTLHLALIPEKCEQREEFIPSLADMNVLSTGSLATLAL